MQHWRGHHAPPEPPPVARSEPDERPGSTLRAGLAGGGRVPAADVLHPPAERGVPEAPLRGFRLGFRPARAPRALAPGALLFPARPRRRRRARAGPAAQLTRCQTRRDPRPPPVAAATPTLGLDTRPAEAAWEEEEAGRGRTRAGGERRRKSRHRHRKPRDDGSAAARVYVKSDPDTWMQSINDQRPPTPPRGRPNANMKNPSLAYF